MMLAALGFVLGAWCLQQQAVLPAAFSILSILPAYGFTRFVACRSSAWLSAISQLLLAALCGFFYAAVLAALRLSDALPHEWEQKNIDIQGVVANLPELTERGERFQFDVEQVLTQNGKIPRHISLNFYHNTSDATALHRQFHAGERWRLTVRLRRPHSTYNPHGFDLEAWALAENIRAMGSIKGKRGYRKLDDAVWSLHYAIERSRERVGERIEMVLQGKPYAGVMRALVIGDESQVNAAQWDVFVRTGILHLISISGLHITMLAGLGFSAVAWLWRRLPRFTLWMPTRKVATVAGVLVALLYASLAGWSVSTQRTFLMLATFAVALLSNHRWLMTEVLAAALCVVVLFDPWAVSAPGFWLSFGAVALIAYVTMYRIEHRTGEAHWLKAALQTQWAITIGLLPLLIPMFGQTSLISPIANAFAIPLVSLLVVPLALLGALLPVDIALQAAHALFSLGMQALLLLSHTSLATWQQAAPPLWATLFAVLGVGWLLLPKGVPMRALGLLLLLPMLLVQPSAPPVGEMRVAVLDVGQGLSVLVQTARHAMLFDTGPKYSSQSDAGSKIIVPFLRGEGIVKLDGMVVSHNDDDHSGGAASVLAQMPVRWLAASYPMPLPEQLHTQRLSCYQGQQWRWDNVRFEVLHPTLASYADASIKDNNRGCVLKVTSAHGSVLLSADIEQVAERVLLETTPEALHSQVLIVPHHGSNTSSTPEFVQAVGAQTVVFTVGYLNRFKHPNPGVWQRYYDNHAQRWRSDYHGEIDMQFTEKGLQIQSWRASHPRYWQDVYEVR